MNEPASSRSETEILTTLQSVFERRSYDELEGAKAGLSSLSDDDLERLRTQYALTLNKHPDRSIYEALVEELAKRDPEAAQKWLGELEGGDRAPALEVMVQSDVEGLVGTLSDVPRDEGWAAGVRVLIDDLKSSDPKTSATWTEVLEKSGF